VPNEAALTAIVVTAGVVDYVPAAVVAVVTAAVVVSLW